jgi:hypothetical protein
MVVSHADPIVTLKQFKEWLEQFPESSVVSVGSNQSAGFLAVGAYAWFDELDGFTPPLNEEAG